MTDYEAEVARRRAVQWRHPALSADCYETSVIGERFFNSEVPEAVRNTKAEEANVDDDGIDFWLWLSTRSGVRRLSLDVKTAKHPFPPWLWAKEVRADLYALVSLDEHIGNFVVGWATAAEVLAAPITVDGGIRHHALHRRDLRPLIQLKRWLSPEPLG